MAVDYGMLGMSKMTEPIIAQGLGTHVLNIKEHMTLKTPPYEICGCLKEHVYKEGPKN